MRVPARGCDPRPVLHDDHQVVDGSVLQRVGELHGIADELIALRGKQHDIALRVDLAGLAVPDHLVRGEQFPSRSMRTAPAGGHYIGVAVISDGIRH